MKTFAVMAAAVIGIGSNISLEPASKVWVEGTSSVRGFKCNAADISSAITTSGSTDIVSLVDDAQVTIPVAKLDCGNGTMNEHMRKALKAKDHPRITFIIASYEIAVAGDSVRGTATGELTLGGVTKTIAVTGDVRPAEGSLRITGGYDVRMTDFGLKPPTLMMGTLKVRDVVKVSFDLLLKDSGPTVALGAPTTR